MLQLPYLIKCDKGDMSFNPWHQWDSTIDPAWSDEEMIEYLTKLFKRSGDNATEMSIEREGAKVIVHWTMNYGKLSPRRCWSELEKKGTPSFAWATLI